MPCPFNRIKLGSPLGSMTLASHGVWAQLTVLAQVLLCRAGFKSNQKECWLCLYIHYCISDVSYQASCYCSLQGSQLGKTTQHFITLIM